jgi:membrane protein DedA with SNARE-associated domain
MPFPRFFVFNASGGIVWASIYGFGYYYAAHVLKKLNTPLTVAFAVIAVLVFVGFVIFIRRNIAEWEERAERALPGPL